MILRRRLASLLSVVMMVVSLQPGMPVYGAALDELPENGIISVEEVETEDTLPGTAEIGDELAIEDESTEYIREKETGLTPDTDMPGAFNDGNGQDTTETEYTIDVYRRNIEGAEFIPGDGLTAVESDYRYKCNVSGNEAFSFTISDADPDDEKTPYATLVSEVLTPSSVDEREGAKYYSYTVSAGQLKNASDIFYGYKSLFVGLADRKLTLSSSSDYKSAVFRAYSGDNLINGPADVYKGETEFAFFSGSRIAICGLSAQVNGNKEPDKYYIRVEAGDRTLYGNCFVNDAEELFDLGNLYGDTEVTIQARTLSESCITAKGEMPGDYTLTCSAEGSADGYVMPNKNGYTRIDISLENTGSSSYVLASDTAKVKVGDTLTETEIYSAADGRYYCLLPFEKIADAAFSHVPSIEITADFMKEEDIIRVEIPNRAKDLVKLVSYNGMASAQVGFVARKGRDISVTVKDLDTSDSYYPYATLLTEKVLEPVVSGDLYTFNVPAADLIKAADYTNSNDPLGHKIIRIGAYDHVVKVGEGSDCKSAVFIAYNGDEKVNGPVDVFKGTTEFRFKSGNRIAISGVGYPEGTYKDFYRVRTGDAVYYGDVFWNDKRELFDLGVLEGNAYVEINGATLSAGSITAKGRTVGDYEVICDVDDRPDGNVVVRKEYGGTRVKLSVTGTKEAAYRIVSNDAKIITGYGEEKNVKLSYDSKEGVYFFDIPSEMLAKAAFEGPSIVITADVAADIPAVKLYPVYVQNGAAAKIGNKTVYSAKEGDTVTVSYKEDQTSKDITFDRWSIEGAASTGDLTSVETSFIMGTSPVQVRYSVKVNDDCKKEELPSDADTKTKVSRLAFESKSLKLRTGEIKKNEAKPEMNGGTAPAVEYITENSDIVAVSPDGSFMALAPGEATVTAYCGNKTAKCKVKVDSYTTDIAIMDSNDVDVTGTVINMLSGEQAVLHVSFLPGDTSDSKKVKWRSSKSAKVKVKDGLVTVSKTLSEPVEVTLTATVECTDTGNGKSISKTVTVKADPVKNEKNQSKAEHTLQARISKKSMNTADKNKAEVSITLKEKKKSGSSIDKCLYEIRSSNERVVSINSASALVSGEAKATVEALRPGFVYITVTSWDPSAPEKINRKRIKVTVKSPVESVKISDSMGLIKDEGGSKTMKIRKGCKDSLTAVIVPDFSTDISRIKITGSGGVSVKNGVLHAKKVSEKAKITVKCGKYTETIKVVVTR